MASRKQMKRSHGEDARGASESSSSSSTDERSFPTFVGTIAQFFRDEDKACMSSRFDLGDYRDVRDNAGIILEVVERGSMPKGGPVWSKDKVGTFRRWARQGCKYRHEPEVRLRRNINSLSQDEMNTLLKAFETLQKPDKNGISRYSTFCDIHANYCLHHLNGFYPWHRLYMQAFENELRQVPGCEDVTLPYWDFTEDPVPDVMFKEPVFAKYSAPSARFDTLNVGVPGQAACILDTQGQYSSARNSAEDVSELFASIVRGDVYCGMMNRSWSGFTGYDQATKTFMPGTVHAHDYGHDRTGQTMQDSRYSPFDPLFFFFHCNFDRIWQSWQEKYHATTLEGFRSTLDPKENKDWVEDGGLLGLRPFVLRNGIVGVYDEADDYASHASTLDLASAFHVKYDALLVPKNSPGALDHPEAGIVAAEFTRVTVSGIDRTRINGNFTVELTTVGKPDDNPPVPPTQVGVMTLLQPNQVSQCPNCQRSSTIKFEFYVSGLTPGEKLSANIRETKHSNAVVITVPEADIHMEQVSGSAHAEGQEVKRVTGANNASFMVSFNH